MGLAERSDDTFLVPETDPSRRSWKPGTVAFAVTLLATLIFIFPASVALRHALLARPAVDAVSASANTAQLLLNIALILFAWRRHKDAVAAAERCAVAERASGADENPWLLNRRTMEARTSDLIGMAAEGAQVALILIDIRRFRAVNEVYGYEVGDRALAGVGRLVRETAPDEAICGRLGDDLFAIAILPERSASERVRALADEILAGLSAAGPAPVVLRGRAGLSLAMAPAVDFHQLLNEASVALAEAKEADADAPVPFDGAMGRKARRRSNIEIGLRNGIGRGQFIPFFQPQVDLASGALVGFEMLARWQHPVSGLLGPNVFIAQAEEAGLIAQLSELLLRQALEEASTWPESLVLSVNISPRELTDRPFLARLMGILGEHGVPAERIDLEITERSLFRDLSEAKAVAGAVRDLGMTLTLDDFGVGFSSISHLRALPFDRLKIDRSFSQSVNSNPESLKVIRGIAQLAESLGVAVTAEGVESAAVELRLRGLGCDRGQGWFFGRAASAVETRTLLAQSLLLHEPRFAHPFNGGPDARSAA